MILPDDPGPPDKQAASPAECILQSLNRIKDLPDHKRCLVLFINDTPGTYDVRFNAGNISISQIAMASAYMHAWAMAELIKNRIPIE